MTGFRAYDPVTGALVVDISTRNGRYLGTVTTSAANGSVTAADFAQGTPFYLPVSLTVNDQNGQSNWPIISVSGTTMTWTYNPTTGTKSNFLIVYGVY